MKRATILATVLAAALSLLAPAWVGAARVAGFGGTGIAMTNLSGNQWPDQVSITHVVGPERFGVVQICNVSNCTGAQPFPTILLTCSVVATTNDASFPSSWYGSGIEGPTELWPEYEGPTYIFRIDNAAPGGTDRFGVRKAVATNDGKCGAARLSTKKLVAGDFERI